MTCETKVGVFVACSFLCLAGLVVSKKLNDAGKAAANDPTLGADDSSSGSDQTTGKGVAQADPTDPVSDQDLKLRKVPKRSVVPVKATSVEGSRGSSPDKPVKVKPNDPFDPDQPVDVSVSKDPNRVEPDNGPSTDRRESSNDDALPPSRGISPSDEENDENGNKTAPMNDPPPPAPEADQGPTDSKNTTPNAIKNSPADDLKNDPPAAAIAAPRTTSGANGKKRFTERTKPETASVADVTIPPVPETPEADASSAPAAEGSPASLESPRVKAIPTRTRASNGVEVEEYDDLAYTCKDRDNFASLSKRFYDNNPKYAAALESYNLEHPQAAEALRQVPLNLAGQRVFIPPIWLLERRYSASREASTRSTGKAVPGADREAPPAPQGKKSGGRPSEAKPLLYTVTAKDGEQMRAIANKKLGDAERWKEIAELNPGFRPELPIPANTQIILPDVAGGK